MSFKGFKQSKETIEKRVKKLIGQKRTEKAKKKMSLAHKGLNTWSKGKKHTKEWTEKIRKSNLGRKRSKQARENMSKAHMGKKRGGNPESWKHTDETKRKISKANKGKLTGNNNPAWQGGTSFKPYGIKFNKELKEKIRKRDNYTCQGCDKIQQELRRKLNIHHIDYDKKNNKENNLIPLCDSCHGKTCFDRLDWINYFKELLKV